MDTPGPNQRRVVLRRLAQAAAAAPLAGAWTALAQTTALPPTPACGAPARTTPRQTAGPFFIPDSPLRQSLLEPGLPGERLTLTGRVLDTNCRPIAKALLDFWQADSVGAYDNRGMRLRGHQFSDATGVFRLETVLPGLYPGRTRHIHVRLQASGGAALTTQLYFPEQTANRGDFFFSPALLVAMQRGAAGNQAVFDFVLG
jgi:protocatechuate 3,4-dioxygenase beta subunit